ncbi:MAG: formate dehydrogenase [Nitratiruptor sp.]|nr:formate dehydrogenase [Nitratiruptor sp.]NPA83030.1 molybdopterin-dependent oxidoreductase [Campylobacterota bacterium]
MELQSVCTYCGVGCDIVAQVEGGRIAKVFADPRGVVSRGHLCIKGRYGHQFLESPQRILGAYVRRSFVEANPHLFGDVSLGEGFGELLAIDYEDGYRIVAAKLREIMAQDGPESLACIGGARTSCESGYLFQKVAREVLGTPHVDNCARVCHSPSLKGLRATIGEGAATNPFDDIYESQHILVVGSNTTEAHPIVANRIIEQVRKGKAKLSIIDVRRIPLAKFAHNTLIIPFESNLLLLNMIARAILERGWENRSFLQERCRGFEEYREAILADPLADPHLFAQMEGYADLVERIYELAYDLTHKRSLILWGLGVTEHLDGSYGVMALSHLALLSGNIGKPGAGLMPLRGQNNVQGACDMGMLPYYLPDYRIPQREGLMTPDIVEAILQGKIRGLWNMGEDLAHIHPNQTKVQQALERLELLVVQEVMFNEITKHAHFIFGVKSGYEKSGVYINAERRLHLSQPLVSSPLPDDWEVIQGIGAHFDASLHYAQSEEVWEEVRRVAPERFAGASYDLLQRKRLEGIQWPVVQGGEGTPRLHVERFRTPDGYGHFHYHQYEMRGMVQELLEGLPRHFYLTTGRILAHYNNGAQTKAVAQLAKRYPEDILWVSQEDRDYFANRDRVVLVSQYGRSAPLPICFTSALRSGTLYTTFHHAASRINYLFGDEGDHFVKTARFKSIQVQVV